MTKEFPKEKLIVVLGPTATGKTRLAVRMAQILKTSIVSGDSMLVYRGLDIGTAKPDENERMGINHALIDIADPTDAGFNAAEFQRLAKAEIHRINLNNRIPILVGGTGLYIKALLEGYQFNKEQQDAEYRMELEKLAHQHGNSYVHAMLKEVDPETAERLHVNDFRRIVRALEVWHIGKAKISQAKQKNGLVYDACVIGLCCERRVLYNRIEKRVDRMIEQGLEREVRTLLSRGIPRNATAMQGIGYKEMVSYIVGEIDFSETVELIKKNTRHFAKRQFTWYKKMPYIHWTDIEVLSDEDILENSLKYIKGFFGTKRN